MLNRAYFKIHLENLSQGSTECKKGLTHSFTNIVLQSFYKGILTDNTLVKGIKEVKIIHNLYWLTQPTYIQFY